MLKQDKVKVYIGLHILFFIYSLGAVCSKFAGQSDFMSLKFLFFYGLVLVDLVIYAILWQQILRKLSLVTAYANKAVTVIWGVIWGLIIFQETITIWKIIGAVIIITGIYMVVVEDAS